MGGVDVLGDTHTHTPRTHIAHIENHQAPQLTHLGLQLRVLLERLEHPPLHQAGESLHCDRKGGGGSWAVVVVSQSIRPDAPLRSTGGWW